MNYKSFVMHIAQWLTRMRFARYVNVISEVLKNKEKGDTLQAVLYDRSVVKERGAKRRLREARKLKQRVSAKSCEGVTRDTPQGDSGPSGDYR